MAICLRNRFLNIIWKTFLVQRGAWKGEYRKENTERRISKEKYRKENIEREI